MNSHNLISVIVPFYKGNTYMNELLSNLDSVGACLAEHNGAKLEVIIVNDSPEIPVEYTVCVNVPVTVISNEHNLGIHGSRIHGLQHASGEYIQFLDQDDLLVPENYVSQLQAIDGYDVVVGNCWYYFGEEKTQLYPNLAAMKYYIQESRFLGIRNMIASPGHCLIRKAALPATWQETPMKVNGSDDYYLWLLMFNAGAAFTQNASCVYIHRNSESGNLSFDLGKMYRSNEEMCGLLNNPAVYPAAKLNTVKRSIYFKYLYDIKQLGLSGWLRFADKVLANIFYKITSITLKFFG